MVADYWCHSCGLCFSAGWFHYFENDPYCAQTFLVGAECGTWHGMEHAFDRPTVPDQLLAHPGPLFREVDPEQFSALERRRAENERWRTEQERRNQLKERWRPSWLPRIDVFDLPKPLFLIGCILLLPVFLILCILISIEDWIGARHPNAADPKPAIPDFVGPSQVIFPEIQAMAAETAPAQKVYWVSERDTFHHLACSHCGAQGALTANWQNETCPYCKQDQLVLFGCWMT